MSDRPDLFRLETIAASSNSDADTDGLGKVSIIEPVIRCLPSFLFGIELRMFEHYCEAMCFKRFEKLFRGY